MDSPSSQSPNEPIDSATDVDTNTDVESNTNTGSEAWTLLAGHVEGFVAAWDGENAPPSISDFLPDTTGPLRRLMLLEAIKIDLEYRWLHHSLPRKVEEYLTEFPDLSAEGFPGDLVYEEFHIRKQAGEDVDPQEYFERFPQQTELIGRHLGIDTPYTPTALFQPKAADKLLEIQAGDRLEDFDLLATLGKGAFATVFLARQISMHRMVALKISADQGAEPQTLAQFDHENIVRVYDQRALPDAGLRLLYMQCVRGGTLLPVVKHVQDTSAEKRTGRLLLKAVDRALDDHGESAPAESSLRKRLAGMGWPEVICWVGSRLADALDYAHRRGVLHRDIKPANVLLTGEGAPKLADFNVSFSSAVSDATPTAYFGGSLPYMSPEQLEAFHPGHVREANSLDERSDIYSLGVVLWELLTGYRPFRDGHLEEGWTATLDQMVDRRHAGVGEDAIKTLPKKIPHGLKTVLLSCLAADPQARPQSGRELAQQLELCLQPRLQDILNPPERGWQRWVLAYAMVALILAAFVPNLLAARFNYVFNDVDIMPLIEAASPLARPTFEKLVTWINGIAFPLGLGLAGYLAFPVFKTIRERGRGVKHTVEHLAQMRNRSLELGHYAACIGILLWTIAGIAYPICFRIVVGSNMPLRVYPHFIASLTICGLIAASYPFLVVTFFTIRAYYPALLTLDQLPRQNFERLTRLGRRTRIYFVLSVLIIFVSILILVAIDTKAKFAVSVLCIAGIVGSYLAFLLYRAIQGDLAVLSIPAIQSGDSGDIHSESVEALASGTWNP